VNTSEQIIDVDNYLSSTTPRRLYVQVKRVVDKISILMKSSSLARSKQEIVFGRHSPFLVMRQIELSALARRALDTKALNYGDWLKHDANADLENAFEVIRSLVRKKFNLTGERRQEEVTFLQELSEVTECFITLLQKQNRIKRPPPHCSFCWRHPLDNEGRLYCFEHVSGRANARNRGDNAGHMAGRRFMSRVAKALGIEASELEIANPSRSTCNKVWAELKARQDAAITEWTRRTEVIQTVTDNLDRFGTKHWSYLATQIDKYRSCLPKVKDHLPSIAPLVHTESREDWVKRVLMLLDNKDAYDDIILNPDHLFGLLARYDMHLYATELVPHSPENKRNYSLHSKVCELREKEELTFEQIGHQLDRSRQRAHAIYAQRKHKNTKKRKTS